MLRGGLGAAVLGLLCGQLHPRYEIVMQYLDLGSFIKEADLVITAEGSLDGQTPFGKVPAEVASRAKKPGNPSSHSQEPSVRGCVLISITELTLSRPF